MWAKTIDIYQKCIRDMLVWNALISAFCVILVLLPDNMFESIAPNIVMWSLFLISSAIILLVLNFFCSVFPENLYLFMIIISFFTTLSVIPNVLILTYAVC